MYLDFDQAVKLILSKIDSWIILIVSNIPNIIISILIMTISTALAGAIALFFQKIIFKKYYLRNLALQSIMLKFIKLLVIILGFIVALSVLGLDKTVFSLMAGVGVAGIAIGFALKDIAANTISGLTVITNNHVRIGDLIEMDKYQGHVIQINLRDTIIKNFDGQILSIPNQYFMTSTIVNYTKSGLRRVSINFGVSYYDNIKNISDVLIKKLNEHSDILSEPNPVLEILSFGSSSIDLCLRFWIEYPKTDIIQIKNEVMTYIKTQVDQGAFSIPYPIQTLDLPKSLLEK